MMKKSSIPPFLYVAIFVCAFALLPLQAAPFEKDIDHDGFPDELETATGYNPAVNEALKKSQADGKCGVIKTDLIKLTKPQNVLIILDISGSMSEPMDNSTKIDVAKRILAKYIDSLPYDMKVGMVIYGKSDCGDNSIEVLAPTGKINRKDLKAKIAKLNPAGSTPIALTLNKTSEFLKGFEGDNNNLILISDGQESCGGDPVKAILDLKQSAVDPEVTVIGLNVDQATRNHLTKIASSSDGVYADVKTEADFINAFAQFFKKLNKFYKDIVCITAQYNSYLTFETDQFNKSKAYLIKAATKAMVDEVRNAVKAVEEKIEQNHKDRVDAKDRLNEMIKNKLDEMEEATNRFVGKE